MPGGTDLIGRDEVREFLQAITDPDAALTEPAGLLDGGDVFRAGMMAFICRVLVERGGSVPVPVDAVLELMERQLHLAKDHADQAGEGSEDELFRSSPDLVRARCSLPFVLFAAMTMWRTSLKSSASANCLPRTWRHGCPPSRTLTGGRGGRQRRWKPSLVRRP